MHNIFRYRKTQLSGFAQYEVYGNNGDDDDDDDDGDDGGWWRW